MLQHMLVQRTQLLNAGRRARPFTGRRVAASQTHARHGDVNTALGTIPYAACFGSPAWGRACPLLLSESQRTNSAAWRRCLCGVLSISQSRRPGSSAVIKRRRFDSSAVPWDRRAASARPSRLLPLSPECLSREEQGTRPRGPAPFGRRPLGARGPCKRIAAAAYPVAIWAGEVCADGTIPTRCSRIVLPCVLPRFTPSASRLFRQQTFLRRCAVGAVPYKYR
jgi:hypothetical protein